MGDRVWRSFFFFKQKTAYEMRISDWSSDVCSSDLKAGDYITHLDGELIYGTDIDTAVSRMRGKAGTAIELTIFRVGREGPFEVSVMRGVIELRSEENTSELQSLMRRSYAVFCLKKKKHNTIKTKEATK